MRLLRTLLNKFGKNESGAFMALFAILSIVLIGTTGAVVDFVSVQQARGDAQLALDSAALALQPQIYSEDAETLRVLANNLLVERLSGQNVAVEVESAEIVAADGTLFLQGRLTVPMSFVSLVGVPEMTTRIASQATRKLLSVEIAMVLDNSGSMASYSRMTNLKSAASSATEILFAGEATQPNVFISIVPFSFLVNVGASNANQPWIDSTGLSSIADDNFDFDDPTLPADAPENRFELYAEIGETWRGCVEARPHTYDINDATPNVSVPDTLFVPMFAPDEPSGYYNSYISDDPASCQTLQGQCSCAATSSPGYWGWGCGWRGGWGYCSGSSSTSCTFTDTDGGVTTGWNACSCSGETILSSTTTYGGGGSTTTTLCDVYSGASLTDLEKQERICKYIGANPSFGSWRGPNGSCTYSEVLPLTNVKANVLSSISAMVADGGTNIHQGAIWGFRTLSPSEPFTEGDDYTSGTYKAMIIMTDGENYYSTTSGINGSYYFNAYGHRSNGRIATTSSSASTIKTEMNTRTVEACQAAQAAGIDVYTIGLNPPNSTTRTMLLNCASSASKAYFPTAASELDSVFADIANQLSSLRLAQ